jgi:hypothetical protein
LFDGDFARYCDAIGIDRRSASLISRFPGGSQLYGRADMYHDGTSLKLLEFNIDSGRNRSRGNLAAAPRGGCVPRLRG